MTTATQSPPGRPRTLADLQRSVDARIHACRMGRKFLDRIDRERTRLESQLVTGTVPGAAVRAKAKLTRIIALLADERASRRGEDAA